MTKKGRPKKKYDTVPLRPYLELADNPHTMAVVNQYDFPKYLHKDEKVFVIQGEQVLYETFSGSSILNFNLLDSFILSADKDMLAGFTKTMVEMANVNYDTKGMRCIRSHNPITGVPFYTYEIVSYDDDDREKMNGHFESSCKRKEIVVDGDTTYIYLTSPEA